MILFFFLLLMLAVAWGVADHYQAILRAEPPATPPAAVAKPATAQQAVGGAQAPTVTADGVADARDAPVDGQGVRWPTPLDAAGNPRPGAAADDQEATTR